MRMFNCFKCPLFNRCIPFHSLLFILQLGLLRLSLNHWKVNGNLKVFTLLTFLIGIPRIRLKYCGNWYVSMEKPNIFAACAKDIAKRDALVVISLQGADLDWRIGNGWKSDLGRKRKIMKKKNNWKVLEKKIEKNKK